MRLIQSSTDFKYCSFLHVMEFRFCFNVVKSTRLGIRNKSFNSQEWLKRREFDPYIDKAKKFNYRCRSAFKLIEIDDRYKFLKPGLKVVDLGAAPGSWSQVLADRTNSNGKAEKMKKGLVIAVDLATFQPINGVISLTQMDFTQESTQNKIIEHLGVNNKLDFVLSDMAPAATGVKCLDQENILNLVYPVVLFAVRHLKQGGGCLAKVWEGQHNQVADKMKKFFKFFCYVKPSATYSSSSELYLLGKDFLGVKI